jgi:PAS domain S-box-containing protein
MDRSVESTTLAEIYARGDRLMVYFHLAHFAVAFELGFFYDTWLVTMLVASLALGAFLTSVRLWPGCFVTRAIAGITLQAFVALHIYQLHGMPEMHFFFFTAFTMMVVYQDPRCMWAGAFLIIGQHILFAAWQNQGWNVHFFPDARVGAVKLFFHFGIALVEVGICSYWSVILRRQTLREAAQIGRLQESERLLEVQLERERAAEQLAAQSEAHVRSIIETALDAVVTMDARGAITGWNVQAEAIFGWPAAEAFGRRMSETIVPPRYREAHEQGLRRFLETGEGPALNRRIEITALRRDGVELPVELAVTTVRTGDALSFCAFIRDLTERRRTEGLLRERDEQLRQAQKMEAVGRLAGGMAHDFNNLLTIIQGRGELLRESLAGDPSSRRDVEMIVRTSQRAAALTQQLLAFSRRQVLRPVVLDLNAVVAQTADMLARLIGEDVEIVTRLERDGCRVRADRTQLEQVLLNLAVNARDAMPEGGRLTIATRREVAAGATPGNGHRAVLEVTDTGVGMTPEVQARAFEPFFTTKDQGKGTGLGLSTVYGIVEQHAGRIGFTSEPGQGTRFTISLPGAEDAPEPRRVEAPVAVEGSGQVILLVEDEVDLRELAAEALRRVGYEVVVAASPRNAIALCEARGGQVDLLLTDVVMPEMNGRELADALQARYPELRVLFMSGYTRDAIAKHGVLEDGIALLDKPFTLPQLHQAVAARLATGEAAAAAVHRGSPG